MCVCCRMEAKVEGVGEGEGACEAVWLGARAEKASVRGKQSGKREENLCCVSAGALRVNA